MTFLTDKALKSKKFKGEKVDICISQGCLFKKKIRNQSQHIFGLKKGFFCGHPKGSFVQNTLLQNIFLFTKYYDHEKISLLKLLESEINRGGGPPGSFLLAKGP